MVVKKTGEAIEDFEKEELVGHWMLNEHYGESQILITRFRLDSDFTAQVDRDGPTGNGRKKGNWKINDKREIGGDMMKFTLNPGVSITFYGEPDHLYKLIFVYSLIDGEKTLISNGIHYVKEKKEN